jgi:hypothetical protein
MLGLATLFSIAIVAGNEHLANRQFLWVLVPLAAANTVCATHLNRGIGMAVFLSGAVIVAATILATYCYLLQTVGNPNGATDVILWHWAGSWKSKYTYLGFLRYTAITSVVWGLALFAVQRISRRQISRDMFLSYLYTASAVSPACALVISRPLFWVSGDPGSSAFFFASGLISLEFPLLLYLFASGLFAWNFRGFAQGFLARTGST